MPVHPNSLKQLKPFKKGEPSANPQGRRLEDPQMRALRRLTRAEITEIGTLILDQNLEQLQKLIENPKTSALKVLICSCVAKGIEKGDSHAMQVILEQMAGKPKQHLTLDGELSVKHYTPDQVKRMAELYLEEGE